MRNSVDLQCWGCVFCLNGSGEHPTSLCGSVLRKLARGEKTVLETPDRTKDFTCVDDVAEAIPIIAEEKAVEVINWGTGTGISVREIANTAARMLGRPELVVAASFPVRDPFDYVVADATRHRQLGWQPGHTLSQGLQKML